MQGIASQEKSNSPVISCGKIKMPEEKTRKELEDERNFWKTLAIGFLLFLITTIILASILEERQRTQLSKFQEQEETWSCPILLEKGKYTFNPRGFLISPSGKELNCEVIE